MRVNATVAVISMPATVNNSGPDLKPTRTSSIKVTGVVTGAPKGGGTHVQELDEVQTNQKAFVERADEEESVREGVVHTQQRMR